jgi:hypothetical protein
MSKRLLSMQIDVMAQDNPAGRLNESGEISLTIKAQRRLLHALAAFFGCLLHASALQLFAKARHHQLVHCCLQNDHGMIRLLELGLDMYWE